MGVGAWVWNLPPLSGRVNQVAYFREIAALGFSHILVKVSDGTRPHNGDDLASDLAVAKIEGLHVWAWGYQYPDPEGFAFLGQRATQAGADGVVVDAEKEWLSEPQEVGPCMAALRTAYVGHVFVSSYASRGIMPDFPWDAFDAACDGWMPQVYGADPSVGELVARAVEDFGHKGLYLAGPADPALGPAMQTAEFLRHCKLRKLPCNLWCWDHMTDEYKAVVQAAYGPPIWTPPEPA
jgi:hypothetical protein